MANYPEFDSAMIMDSDNNPDLSPATHLSLGNGSQFIHFKVKWVMGYICLLLPCASGFIGLYQHGLISLYH